MNDEAVYRTAPATPGLLNTEAVLNHLKVQEEVQERGFTILTSPSLVNFYKKIMNKIWRISIPAFRLSFIFVSHFVQNVSFLPIISLRC